MNPGRSRVARQQSRCRESELDELREPFAPRRKRGRAFSDPSPATRIACPTLRKASRGRTLEPCNARYRSAPLVAFGSSAGANVREPMTRMGGKANQAGPLTAQASTRAVSPLRLINGVRPSARTFNPFRRLGRAAAERTQAVEVDSGRQCPPEPNFRPDTPLPVAGAGADRVVLLGSAFRRRRFASQVPEASWRKPKAQPLLRTKARFFSLSSPSLVSAG